VRGGALAISKSDPRRGKGHKPVTSNLVGGHVRRGEKDVTHDMAALVLVNPGVS